VADPSVLVGAEHYSDAAVYRLRDDLAIVQTVDFFSPTVDDPYTFGQIAASNALSDCFAIGAEARTCLNIVGYPDDKLDMDILGEILAGGAERVGLAGATVVGGHSVRDQEIKYGLAVTGTVDPRRMLTNAGARPGHVLVLTKALGTGLITTADKKGACPPEVLAGAIESMKTLNRGAGEAARDLLASGVTDITGFGLAVHAGEMAIASGVTLALDLERLPLLEGAEALATPEHHCRASKTNREHGERGLRLERDELAGSARAEFLFDPQTSGGLLVAIAPSSAQELIARCGESGLGDAVVVGEVKEPEPGVRVLVR